MASIWPPKSQKKYTFVCILLHEFTLVSKFNAALRLQIRFESDRLWPFLFQSLVKISKRKTQFLCEPPFYSDTMLLVSYESVQKFQRKLFLHGKKIQNPIVSQVNQSINQSMSILSNWGLVDFHLPSIMGQEMWASLFLLIGSWTGPFGNKNKLRTFTAAFTNLKIERNSSPKSSLQEVWLWGQFQLFFGLRFQTNTQISEKIILHLSNKWVSFIFMPDLKFCSALTICYRRMNDILLFQKQSINQSSADLTLSLWRKKKWCRNKKWPLEFILSLLHDVHKFNQVCLASCTKDFLTQ